MQETKQARPFTLLIVVLLMCAIALSATFYRVPTANASGFACQITYTVETQWNASATQPGGFEALVSIKNTGTTTINGWTLQFSFLNGQTIFNRFGANFTQTGADVTVTNLSFNGTIAPGADVFYTPGFLANWFGVNNPPGAFTVNGVACTQ